MSREKITKIKEILENKKSLDHAIALLHWDLETEAPVMGTDKIAKTIGYMSGVSYSIVIKDEFKENVING